MIARAAIAMACVTLALISLGGGGRDPGVAVAWQITAGLALGLAALLPREREAAWLRVALALAALVIGLSAMQADRSEASWRQGLAWILAVAPAIALAAGLRAHVRDAVATSGEAWAPRMRHALAWVFVLAGGALVAIQVLGQAGLAPWGRAGAGDSWRPLGTFMDPNQMACTIVLAGAVMLALASTTGVGAACGALGGVTLLLALLTQSRAALLAVGAVLLVEAWRRHRALGRAGRRRLAAAAAVSLALATAAAILIAHGRRGEADAWARPLIWAGALPAAIERPVLGLGPAGFQSEWPRFQRAVPRGFGLHAKRATTPHGEWLRLPIELGLAGVLALGGVGWALVRRARGSRLWLLTPLAGAIPTIVHDAFHAPAYAAWLAACCVPAVALAAPGIARASAAAAGARRRLAAGVALALLVGASVRLQLAERGRRATGDDRGAGLATAMAYSPGDIDGLLAMAVALEAWPGADRHALRAGVVLQEAVRRAPRDAAAAAELARWMERARRRVVPEASFGRVDMAFEHAAALAPADAWLRAEHAAAAGRAGLPERAAHVARQALAIEPHLAIARAFLVMALEEMQRPDLASVERAALRADLAALERTDLSDYERSLLKLPAELADDALR